MRKQSDETGTTSTTVGASFMNWRGDVALGGNAQTQFNVGKDTQLTARANLNRSVCSLPASHVRRSRSATFVAAAVLDSSRCVRAPMSACSWQLWALCLSCAPSLAACALATTEGRAFPLPCKWCMRVAFSSVSSLRRVVCPAWSCCLPVARVQPAHGTEQLLVAKATRHP